jgi:uncharacterized membrane protein YfcA
VDLPTAIAVLVIVGLAALTQSVAGFGFGLLVAPPLALLIGPKETVLVSNILSSGLNLAMASRLHEHVDWRLWTTLLAGALVGMPIGLAILIWIDPDALKLVIAGSVVVFTLLLLRGLQVHHGGRVGDGLIGIISGVLNTSTSMSGPPVVLYLQGQGASPERFRGTLTAYFFVTSLIAVGLLALGGRFDRDAGLAALIGFPALALGWLAGDLVYRRVDPSRFRRLVFGVLFASAGIAIVTVLVG